MQILLIFAFILFPAFSNAQAPETTIAITREVIDAKVVAGDIITYDPEAGVYRLARWGDEKLELGVVVEDALLLFRVSGGVPVAHSGIVPVQVTTLGGPITPGDLIVPSQISGKGMKASSGMGEGLGIAREAFDMATSSTDSVIQDGEIKVAYGTVLVSLAASKLGAFEAVKIEEEIAPDEAETPRLVGIALFAAFLARLIAAVLITGFAIFFAYRMYEKHVVAGIESVGRNPLAKATIQGMVFFNMALIAVISAAAIALSIMIVVLPL